MNKRSMSRRSERNVSRDQPMRRAISVSNRAENLKVSDSMRATATTDTPAEAALGINIVKKRGRPPGAKSKKTLSLNK